MESVTKLDDIFHLSVQGLLMLSLTCAPECTEKIPVPLDTATSAAAFRTRLVGQKQTHHDKGTMTTTFNGPWTVQRKTNNICRFICLRHFNSLNASGKQVGDIAWSQLSLTTWRIHQDYRFGKYEAWSRWFLEKRARGFLLFRLGVCRKWIVYATGGCGCFCLCRVLETGECCVFVRLGFIVIVSGITINKQSQMFITKPRVYIIALFADKTRGQRSEQ